MEPIVDADAVKKAEGNIAAPKVGRRPNGSAMRIHRGQRAGHVREGAARNLGDPDASAALSRETAERGASERSRGVGMSERRVRAVKRGNRPEGPRRAKGGAGSRNRRGKDDGDSELYNHPNETLTDRKAGPRERSSRRLTEPFASPDRTVRAPRRPGRWRARARTGSAFGVARRERAPLSRGARRGLPSRAGQQVRCSSTSRRRRPPDRKSTRLNSSH